VATVRIKDRPENRDMLAKFSYCGALPKFEGFRFCDGCIELSFEDLENRPVHITEKAFLQFFKDVYECATKGISIGPVEQENVFVNRDRIIVIPSFKEELNIVNGRIENPSSFFTTIRTFAQEFKSTSPFLMKVFKEGIPAILDIMKNLKLDVPSTPFFLPSIGVWRHGPLLEKVQSEKGFVQIPISDGGIFSKFLKGQVFSSIDEIIDHLKENFKIQGVNLESADPSALAFFFKTDENTTYIFNCGDSVEMVTFVKSFVKFKKGLHIIAIHDPIFDFEDGEKIEFPVISPKELDWFFNTFFTSDFVFEGDPKSLFEISKGENFTISKFVREGKWKFENDKWHVAPKIPAKPSAAAYLLKARALMKTGEKPYLGLEFINTSSKIADRNVESFESARAFFHKVLGEYEVMMNDLKRADAFGKKAFRNAYFGIVMAMNGFDPVLSEESASSFIETCRKYVQFVKNGENYDKIYDQVLRPLENFKENMARRVEVMARNYIGILHLGKNENEEAIDEFETALSMAREENFKDLVPLVEMNIGYALSKMSPHASQERLNTALKEAIEEGLWKTFQIINLAMAQNFIEMGNFSKARENLDLVESLEVDFKSEVELLRSRITVEDLTLNISSSKTNDEMMMLKFIKALYMDDEKSALEFLKMTKSNDSEYLKDVAIEPLKIIETITLPQNPFAIYFLSKLKSMRVLKMMKKYGEKLYRDGFLTNAIFYEEQLAKIYKLFGWQKSADLHLEIASNMAQSLGLRNRANEIRKRLKDPQEILEFLNISNSCLYSINLESAGEVIETIAIELSKHVESRVLCRISGIEEIGYVCGKDGISYQTDESVKIDSWTIDDEKFVYDFSIRGGKVFIQIDKAKIDMDKIVAILDILVPIYKLKLEKVIASKISDLDQLTNLYTRRYIFERLYEEVERSRRYKEFLSVAMIDIDDFKRINDTYGHDVGDEVLRKVAETLRSSTRKIDVIGRYGGEEFLAIFPHTPLDQSIKSAQRMLKNVRENFKWMKLTLSLGVAELTPECNNVEQLVKCADIALYRAKLAGKNRIVKYNELEV